MFLLPAVATGDPFSWAWHLLIVVFIGAVMKLIRTLSKAARIELWARFSKRHGNASKGVQKLIEQSSQEDLLPRKWRKPK